jgi:predicted peptidase
MNLFARRTISVQGIETIYRIYEPKNVKSPLPLLLFLHGAGESGSDGLLQTTVGIGPAIVREPERFPALVVFPQASRGYGWRAFNLAAAVAALDDVQAQYDVDRDRVSVTGISMGGYGTWLLAVQQPERFAAAVPVCGGLDRAAMMTHAQAAARLASMPQWVFHGDRDDIIPPDESRIMVRALEEAGAPVRYTEYKGVRHNSWDRAYAEPELVPWLLSRNRAGRLQ